MLVTEGEGDYGVPGETIRVWKGSLVLTPPFQEHFWRGAGKPFAHYALPFVPSPGYGEGYRPGAGSTRLLLLEAADSPKGTTVDGNFRATVRYVDARRGIDVLLPPCIHSFPRPVEYLSREIIELRACADPEPLASLALRIASLALRILAGFVDPSSDAAPASRSRLSRAAANSPSPDGGARP